MSEQLELLQQQIVNLTQGYQTLVQRHAQDSQRLEHMSDYFMALVKVVDDGKPLSSENVVNGMVAQRVERFDNNIKELLDKGVFKKVSQVGPESTLIVKQFNEKGEEVSHRLQVNMGSVKEDLKANLLNKVVGDKVQLVTKDNNTLFEVLQILEEVAEVSLPT